MTKFSNRLFFGHIVHTHFNSKSLDLTLMSSAKGKSMSPWGLIQDRSTEKCRWFFKNYVVQREVCKLSCFFRSCGLKKICTILFIKNLKICHGFRNQMLVYICYNLQNVLCACIRRRYTWYVYKWRINYFRLNLKWVPERRSQS